VAGGLIKEEEEDSLESISLESIPGSLKVKKFRF
jgi:hypothetical protein